MRFKRNKVWVAVDDAGQLCVEKGKVLVKYQLDQEHQYWVHEKSVHPLEPEAPVEAEAPGSNSEPPSDAPPSLTSTPVSEANALPKAIHIYTDGACSGNPGLSGIVVIVGNYGSGKTEVAVNLAMHQHNLGTRVRIADLDLVNPYFRTREARNTLKAMGIDVVLPPEQLMQADLPIVMPQVAGLLRAPGELSILDVGGDEVGATVLASLADVFGELDQSIQVFQVVNPFRPNTDSVEGCLKMRHAIEHRACMSVSKWVGNTHMLEETTIEVIYRGAVFMASLEKAGDVAVEFITAPQHLVPELNMKQLRRPVLPIYRQLVPPWRKAEQPTQSADVG